MNLYFRLILVFIKSLFAGKRHPLEASVVHFRVWPLDCDVNLHLTNSRYFAFADLGRVHLLGQMGVLRPFLKRRWFPVNNATEISFIRPIEPLQKFRIVSRLVTWDDKYWYTEHKFEVAGTLHAVSLARGVIVRQATVVPVNDVIHLLNEMTGETVSIPAPPVPVREWRELLSVKKDCYSIGC